MEYSANRQSEYKDINALKAVKIQTPDPSVREAAMRIWDDVAKPLDGMGDFEVIISRIAAIKGSADFTLDRKAHIIMIADNGIVEEGVSQSGSEVTLSVAGNMVRGKSSVAVMAENRGIKTFIYDVGMKCDNPPEGCINAKVNRGTANFRIKKAMTAEEAMQAIMCGMDAVSACAKEGYDIISCGEMGIGNTTTSAAVCASLLKADSDIVTGRGAGLDNRKLQVKKQIIREAVKKYDLYNADAFDVLCAVGGYDIAALAGVCIGGALYRMPVVLDGVITMTAALLADRIIPGIRDYLILSHMGKEPASRLIADELKLKAVIDANMALGEGSGAVMMLSLLDDAYCVYTKAARFSDIRLENYVRFSKED